MINFTKYQGAGNDFILVDGRELSLPPNEIVSLCNRKRGVGADGLIFLRKSLVASFGMEIFNADGSHAKMCGNGLRCLARFIEKLGFSDPVQTIETPSGVLTTRLVEDAVCNTMPKPTLHNLEMEVEGIRGAFLDTGVPHFVMFVEEIEKAPLEMGPILRDSPLFGKEGANINWVQAIDSQNLLIRTYERGVEEETLACGTGACAAAFAFDAKNKIFVTTRSGDRLTIDCQGPTLTGPAEEVFTGTTRANPIRMAKKHPIEING